MIELHERTGIAPSPVVRDEGASPPVSFHHFASSRAGNRRTTRTARRCEVRRADHRSLLIPGAGLVPDWRAVSNRSLFLRTLRTPLLRSFELCDEQIHGAFEHDGNITIRVRVAQ
jgi:hypothetical protein